jgi:hypothetical protein
MLLMCMCLLTQIISGYCEDYDTLVPGYSDDDDLFGMVNIYVYNSNNDCLINNMMIEKMYNFNIKCDCLKKAECYDKLSTNSEFNNTYIDYNNTKLYIHDFNYSGHCYKYETVYIRGILSIDHYCVPKIIGLIVLGIVIICAIFIILNIVYDLKKKKHIPPKYKPTHYNTI